MGLCYRTLCFHHKILRTQQNKPSGDILRYVLLKENPIKPFFFFFPCVQRVSSSDWLMSVGYLFLPPNWYAAFWNESLPAVVSAVWRMGAGWDCLCFFFHFFFFFASSSDMASLGGGVSPSESFHPHQGSRAVTTGIRLITHSPRRLHK